MRETRKIRRLDARRGGFSLVELLLTMSIIGILAGLAIPNLRNMTYRARAAEVAADLEVIRVGVTTYNGDTFTWPADGTQAEVPADLVPFLPTGFQFVGAGYELKYDNYSVPGGLPGDPSTTQLIGASVIAETDELSHAIMELLGGSLVFSVGRKHTVVVYRN